MMCGDDSPPPPPAPVIIQPPPPITQSAGEASTASADSLQALLDRGLLPRYAQQLTDIQKTQSPILAQNDLDIQKQFAPQLTQIALDQLKQADPTGFSIRQNLGDKILGQLSPDQYGKLSQGESRQAEQDIRAGQVARGGGTGLGDSIEEALSKYNLGRGIQQQQLANAGSFLAGTPPQASFGSLNQAGQTAPVGTQNVQGVASQLFPSTNALIGQQSANYAQMSNNANALNHLNQSNFQYNDQNTSNPFLTGLSAFGAWSGQILGGAASNSGGMAAAFCWVAEELYGKEHEKTHRVRAFVRKHFGEDSPLGKFCFNYWVHGQEWAEQIKDNMTLRARSMKLWDSLNDQAISEGL